MGGVLDYFFSSNPVETHKSHTFLRATSSRHRMSRRNHVWILASERDHTNRVVGSTKEAAIGTIGTFQKNKVKTLCSARRQCITTCFFSFFLSFRWWFMIFVDNFISCKQPKKSAKSETSDCANKVLFCYFGWERRHLAFTVSIISHILLNQHHFQAVSRSHSLLRVHGQPPVLISLTRLSGFTFK